MPLDPAQDAVVRASPNPLQSMLATISDFGRRLRALETGNQGRRVYVGAGAPTTVAPDGALYVDTAGLRLYVRAAGGWHYAALT